MQSREEILNKIIEIIDPIDEVTEDTVIADSLDFDSLGLFNIMMFYKASGAKLTLETLVSCKKVADLITLLQREPSK